MRCDCGYEYQSHDIKESISAEDDERPENYIQEVTVATGIVIVKQYEKMVVLRLGQYTGSLKSAGFHFLVPFFYTGKIVDTREVPERVPTQQYITKDNVVVNMDFVLYYRVLPDHAEKSVLEVANHRLGA